MADVKSLLIRVHTEEKRSLNALRLICVFFTLAGLVFAVIAFALDDIFYLRLASEALILAGMAISVDLLLGISRSGFASVRVDSDSITRCLLCVNYLRLRTGNIESDL